MSARSTIYVCETEYKIIVILLSVCDNDARGYYYKGTMHITCLDCVRFFFILFFFIPEYNFQFHFSKSSVSEPAAAQLLAWRKSCRLHIVCVCVCVCGKRSGVETNKFQPNISWRRQGDVYEVRIRETVQVTPSLLLVDVYVAQRTHLMYLKKKNLTHADM